MPALDHWTQQFGVAVLIDPRAIRQVVGEAPIQRPTQVIHIGVADHSDCRTKGHLRQTQFTWKISTTKIREKNEMRRTPFMEELCAS